MPSTIFRGPLLHRRLGFQTKLKCISEREVAHFGRCLILLRGIGRNADTRVEIDYPHAKSGTSLSATIKFADFASELLVCTGP